MKRVVELETMLWGHRDAVGEQVIVQALKEMVVTARIDIAQLRARDVLQPQVVPGPALDLEPCLDIAQALFARCLGLEVDDQLVPGGKVLGVAIGPGPLHFTMERSTGDQVNQLSENCVRICHGRPPFWVDCFFGQKQFYLIGKPAANLQLY
jgi:hypothetical protein